MSENQLHISVFQFDIFWENIESNLSEIIRLLDKTTSETDLVVLPETFSTGFTNNSKGFALSFNDTAFQELIHQAKIKNTAICGSLIMTDQKHFYNRFIFIHPDGLVQYYDKRHLFSMSEEDKYFTAGNEQIIINYKGWRIMPQVCYDLRFPVWSRNIHNYDILIYVANWPGVRQHVWETLLKARAIENQCYVIGSNRTGNDGKGVYYLGGSAVIDPKGNLKAGAGNEPLILKSSLNRQELLDFRKKFPVLNDRDQFEVKT